MATKVRMKVSDPPRRGARARPDPRRLRRQPAAAGHRRHRPLPGPRARSRDAAGGDAGGARRARARRQGARARRLQLPRLAARVGGRAAGPRGLVAVRVAAAAVLAGRALGRGRAAAVLPRGRDRRDPVGPARRRLPHRQVLARHRRRRRARRMADAGDDIEEARHRRAVERNFRVVDEAEAIAAATRRDDRPGRARVAARRRGRRRRRSSGRARSSTSRTCSARSTCELTGDERARLEAPAAAARDVPAADARRAARARRAGDALARAAPSSALEVARRRSRRRPRRARSGRPGRLRTTTPAVGEPVAGGLGLGVLPRDERRVAARARRSGRARPGAPPAARPARAAGVHGVEPVALEHLQRGEAEREPPRARATGVS